MVDVVYRSNGRVIARSLSESIVASLPLQTEVIPVLEGPMHAFDMSSETAAILNATKHRLKTEGANPIIERMIGDITPDRIRESLNYLTGVTSSIKCAHHTHPPPSPPPPSSSSSLEAFNSMAVGNKIPVNHTSSPTRLCAFIHTTLHQSPPPARLPS
jgi:hypothetical protein